MGELQARELLHKTEEIDTHQNQLPHVAELQHAQEQAQQNPSRELDQKNDASAILQEQLLLQAQAQVNEKSAETDAIQKKLNAALVEADGLHAAMHDLQQKHDQEISKKDEEIDALRRQAQQVHAQISDMQIAQERLRENHSREVCQKDARIDALHKELEHVREELILAARRFEEAMERQCHNGGETIQNDSHWTCPTCDELNKSSRAICNNCDGPRPVACVAAPTHPAIPDPRTSADVPFKHPKVSQEDTPAVANQDNGNAGAAQAGGHVWRRRDSLWTCPKCDEVNKSSRAICNNCEVPRSVARVAVPTHAATLEPPTSTEVPFKRAKVSKEDTQ